MSSRLAQILPRVLVHEGGYVNHPADPGGPTMKGVTLAVFSAFKGRPQTPDELRHISDADLEAIYRMQYWARVRGDDLPKGVDYAVFDFGVNSGTTRAVEFLQREVGAAADGRIGPNTLAAVRGKPASAVINDLCDARLAFLRGLRTWPTFGDGWSARVAGVRQLALQDARGA